MAKSKPTTEEEFLQQLADAIDEHYERVDSFKDVEAFIGTEEIYDALQNIFPAPALYGPLEVTHVLLENGFEFAPIDGPPMQFAWLIRRR